MKKDLFIKPNIKLSSTECLCGCKRSIISNTILSIVSVCGLYFKDKILIHKGFVCFSNSNQEYDKMYLPDRVGIGRALLFTLKNTNNSEVIKYLNSIKTGCINILYIDNKIHIDDNYNEIIEAI